MADVMISTTNLTKKYGNKTVVDNVTINIERGGIIGLVGQNGAGKTTLIRLLTGLVKPTSGSFELLRNQQRLPHDVAAIVERPSIYGNMSAMDNLAAQSMLLGFKVDKEYLGKTLQLVGLEPNLPQKAKDFSLGMKQRLAIAMTLVGRPQLLILDEPTNGLDPQGIVDMREVFVNLNRQLGVTIIISSHLLSELGKFATEFYIMDCGRVLKHVMAEEIKHINGMRICLYVDNVDKTVEALKDSGNAVVSGVGQVILNTDKPLTQIMLTLAQAGVTVLNLVQMGDALEDYYLQIIRDARDPFAYTPTNGGAL